MIRKWHAMALPVLAFAIAISGVLPTSAWAVDTWPVEAKLPVTKLSITLGATITPMIGTDPAGKQIHRAYLGVTRYIDIDEDGVELDRIAIVAPARLNLVEGQKYQLKIVNASASTHNFWAPKFNALSAKTTQLTVDKGKIRNMVSFDQEKELLTTETEIRPGGTAVWEFVPQMAGKFKWGCSNPSHADAGVKGEIVVATETSG